MINQELLYVRICREFTHHYQEVLSKQDYADMEALTQRTADLAKTFVCGFTCPEVSTNTTLKRGNNSLGTPYALTVVFLPKTLPEVSFDGIKHRMEALLSSAQEMYPAEAALTENTALDLAYAVNQQGELGLATPQPRSITTLSWELTQRFNKKYTIILKGIYRKENT